MAHSRLINTGFTFLNKEQFVEDNPRQIVVVGISRGATSVVAGALHHLGVPLGDSAKPPIFEDRELSEAFERNDLRVANAVIERYDARHPIWAWKRPDSIQYLRKVDRSMNNPHYIFAFRDVFSIANRKVISRKLDTFQEMKHALGLYEKMVKFASRTKRPAMLVSAEKLLIKKERFVDGLISGFALRATPEQREAAIAFITTDPKDYLAKTVFTHSLGFVDEMSRERIRGWARSASHHDPVTVEVRADQRVVKTVAANGYREGLKRKGIHPSGHCAFHVDVSDVDWPERKVKVEVAVAGDIAPLKNGEALI